MVEQTSEPLIPLNVSGDRCSEVFFPWGHTTRMGESRGQPGPMVLYLVNGTGFHCQSLCAYCEPGSEGWPRGMWPHSHTASPSTALTLLQGHSPQKAPLIGRDAIDPLGWCIPLLSLSSLFHDLPQTTHMLPLCAPWVFAGWTALSSFLLRLPQRQNETIPSIHCNRGQPSPRIAFSGKGG